jgi:hypothetical protein
LGTALVACALALALSVWGTKTPDILFTAYTILLGWVLTTPFLQLVRAVPAFGWLPEDWIICFNPFWLALAPYTNPGITDFTHIAAFLLFALSLSALLAAIAARNLRRVALRQAVSRVVHARPRPIQFARPIDRRLPGHSLPGPSLDANPVLWREWHRNQPSVLNYLLWLVQASFSTICLVVILCNTLLSSTFDGGATVWPCIFMGESIAFGLLILSITAPSALTEERARGSLDVLMATPLSTLSIYWGKWWGSFRGAVLIVTPPALAAIALGIRTGDFICPALEVGIVLAYAATYTSLGLALATWMPRPSRAIATSVAIYALVTFGWVVLLAMTTSLLGDDGGGRAAGSSFFGSALPLAEMCTVSETKPKMLMWILFWIAIHAVITAGLIALTLVTFNRCLGRASNRRGRPPSVPQGA